MSVAVALLIGTVGGLVGGGVLGYWLATHIHSVAAQAASGITRATTIPGGVAATLGPLAAPAQDLLTAAAKPAVDAASKLSEG